MHFHFTGLEITGVRVPYEIGGPREGMRLDFFQT